MKLPNERIVILTGHYGSGKTNLAINLAFDYARGGKKVCLVDLDIVNPYFRAADLKHPLEKQGVRVIAPLFAGSNLDIPALPGEINTVFDDRSYVVILDVGGDDAGAAALGRYAGPILEENNYAHLCVVNARRALTRSPEEAAAVLREIRAVGRVPVTALVNNTNLAGETTAQTAVESLAFAETAAQLCSLPLAFTSVRRDLAAEAQAMREQAAFYPVDIYVKPPW